MSQKAVDHKTRQANALLSAALEQQQKNNSPGAEKIYRRMLGLDPHSKAAWYGLGTLAQQKGKGDDARAAYDKALEIDPDFMSALFSEAMLLRSRDPDRAVKLLKRAVAAQPKAAALRMPLGLLLAETDHAQEAEQQFRHAVAIRPSLLSQVPKKFRDSVSPSPASSEERSGR